MRVCFVYRDPEGGGTSIEEIFKGLAKQLSGKIELYDFQYSRTWSFIKNVRKLNDIRADIYHITGGVYFLTYFLWSHPVILTIHDIGRYKELKGLKKWIYKIFLLRGPMEWATAITTVSDFTKDDILRVFGRRIANKVVMIHNPIPGLFVKSDKVFNHSHPRILQVGTGVNKNLGSVIKAVAGMALTLVIIGRISKEDLDLLQEFNIRYENYYDLEYHEVYQQYCLSDIVIFVSTHEGFGMPVLEAQVTGRVVIASRVASIPEIGGEGVHYIEDPFSIKEINEGITKVMEDEVYRRGKIKMGFQNADRYSATKIALEYYNLFKSV